MDDNSWEYVCRKNCSGIVAIVGMTEDKKVVLVEQPRPAVGKRVIEFPAGLVNDRPGKPKESFARAAKREFLEETGYAAGKMKFLMKGPVSPGLSGEAVDFYLASGLRKKHRGGGDETENITVHEVPLSGIETWLKKMQKKGKAVDPKIYAGLYFLTLPKA